MMWDHKDLFKSKGGSRKFKLECNECRREETLHNKVSNIGICNQCYWNNITEERNNNLYLKVWG